MEVDKLEIVLRLELIILIFVALIFQERHSFSLSSGFYPFLSLMLLKY